MDKWTMQDGGFSYRGGTPMRDAFLLRTLNLYEDQLDHECGRDIKSLTVGTLAGALVPGGALGEKSAIELAAPADLGEEVDRFVNGLTRASVTDGTDYSLILVIIPGMRIPPDSIVSHMRVADEG